MGIIGRRGVVIVALVVGLGAATFAGRSTATPGTDPQPAPTGPASVPGQPFDPGPASAAPAAAPTDGSEPPPPAAGIRSVLGPDDRTPVADTTTYPASAIGRLTFRQQGRLFFCTAFLIAADTVATAGHCVHDGFSGPVDGFSADVTFTPGQRGVGAGSAPFGSCGGVEVTGSEPWLQGRDERFDLGFVRLDCTVGDTVGWFGFEPGGADQAAGATVTLQGYPFDKPEGTQWTDDDSVTAMVDRQTFYGADTAPGQSGSPVFQRRGCRGASGACVVAVHAYGVHGAGPHRAQNHGTSVTAAVAGQFHTAIDAPVG